jgi:integrase
MAKKRGNGEGTISQRKDGRWEGKLTIGYDPQSGKTKRSTFYGKTRQEVRSKMDDVKVQMKLGSYVQNNKINVGDWLCQWLDVYAQSRIRISTFEKYKSLVQKHIVPSLGKMLISDLRPEHIQRFYNEKLKQGRVDGKGGLSEKTVGEFHLIIHQALDQAIKEGFLSKNVIDAIRKPQFKTYEIQPLSEEEVKKFLETITHHPYYEPLLLECYTGLRRGELLGLRWSDVDLKNNTVSIKQSLIRTKQGLCFSEPKTAKSRRTIPIPQQLSNVLKRYKVKQNESKLVAGSAYQDKGLLFCNPAGSPLDPRSFTKAFKKVLVDANLLKIRFHDMRHTHATLLLLLNEHPKVVQERLGHSTIRMTLDTYSHVIPGMQEKATQKLDRLFSNTDNHQVLEK